MTTTEPRTLFRLQNVHPELESAVRAVLDAPRTPSAGPLTRRDPGPFPVPAAGIDCTFAAEEVSWSGEYSGFLAEPASFRSHRPAALILLIVDREVYALSWGEGHRLLPTALKDPYFGRRFVVRAADADDIRAAVSHGLGRGRTDATIVPSGAPLWEFGLDRADGVVAQLTVRLRNTRLTAQRGADADRVRVCEGGSGLRLRYGNCPGALVTDVRTIAEVCRTREPHPELRFVERITRVEEELDREILDLELARLLGVESGVRLRAAVRADRIEDYERARCFGLRIGGTDAEQPPSDDLDLTSLEAHLRRCREHTRLDCLRTTTVTLYDSDQRRPKDAFRRDRLEHWLETELCYDGTQYVFTHGGWHRFDQAYLDSVDGAFARLLAPASAYALPPWPSDMSERDYNDLRPPLYGYVNLDRKLATSEFHNGRGVEICDLVAPDDALIMVKRSSGADTLSHLATQGVAGVEALLLQPQTHHAFRAHYAKRSGGDELPPDFRPHKAVFAVQLKNHDHVTPESVPPLGKIALVEAARRLRSYRIAVEVVGIPHARSDSSDLPDVA